MKKAVFLTVSFLLMTGTLSFAQNKSLQIYKDGSVIRSIPVSSIDSIKFKEVTTEDYGIEMVSVPGGTTTLNERSVTISDFKIGKYEVTQKQWYDVMGSWPDGSTIYNPGDLAPSTYYGKGDNYPIYYVSWNDAQLFLTKLHLLTGKNYRLPTEAEWEYAAKGGQKTHNYTYSGSNVLNYAGWYSGNAGNRTHVGGELDANELGIYDMSGNVWEWCGDWYSSTYPSGADNPTGAASGIYRICRGGYFGDEASYCSVSHRRYEFAYHSTVPCGFRVVLVP